ncbi:hypothetical protein NW762_013377 [Fusarium torreyae]|uniref:Uncharacterized protein n=1 Tax=Fusarium torreyae TaxID=1237075 RepID=A0A9W8RNF7_9HYPO|nr:hypothetical protein NW762_013377 [Fusarium torreyae]
MGYATRSGSRRLAEQQVMTPPKNPSLRSDANRALTAHSPSRPQERTICKPKDSMAVNKRRQDSQLVGKRRSNRTSRTLEDPIASDTSNVSETIARSSLGTTDGHQNKEIRHKIRHLMQLEMSRLERKVDFDERYAKFRQELAPDVTGGLTL